MKKVDDVYLRAAEQVNGFNQCSCLAIAFAENNHAGQYDTCPSVIAYSELFIPDNAEGHLAWWRIASKNEKDVHDCRVLALLFAHAMRQTGDL